VDALELPDVAIPRIKREKAWTIKNRPAEEQLDVEVDRFDSALTYLYDRLRFAQMRSRDR
jgi:hypothetical protein